MSKMFWVRFRLRLLPNTPELGHTRSPRALLIRPSLCATSPCHTRFPLTGAFFGLGSMRLLSTSL